MFTKMGVLQEDDINWQLQNQSGNPGFITTFKASMHQPHHDMNKMSSCSPRMADNKAAAVDGSAEHPHNGMDCRSGYPKLDLPSLGNEPSTSTTSSSSRHLDHLRAVAIRKKKKKMMMRIEGGKKKKKLLSEAGNATVDLSVLEAQYAARQLLVRKDIN
ncbi:hypothetical protein Cni_G07737 [Canna indica]|uniref:Uncharacterized protein n=1 Tax=Canna indica TaxID=4628 RepID=A0AAQ3Q769_9LILI|nr:hypothetical protein Cni_G07737 [Canna indica]